MDIVTDKIQASTARGGWWARASAARWVWVSLLLFAATRLGILLVAYLAAGLFADSPFVAPYHLRGTSNVLLDVFGSRWDAGFYVSIAEEGYRYQGVPQPSVAFFPLYPLLMRTLGALVGDVLVAGIVISNTTLLLATMLLYRLADQSWGQTVAERTIWYFLISPAAFFGTAVSSESLFLLAAIGALAALLTEFKDNDDIALIIPSLGVEVSDKNDVIDTLQNLLPRHSCDNTTSDSVIPTTESRVAAGSKFE